MKWGRRKNTRRRRRPIPGLGTHTFRQTMGASRSAGLVAGRGSAVPMSHWLSSAAVPPLLSGSFSFRNSRWPQQLHTDRAGHARVPGCQDQISAEATIRLNLAKTWNGTFQVRVCFLGTLNGRPRPCLRAVLPPDLPMGIMMPLLPAFPNYFI